MAPDLSADHHVAIEKRIKGFSKVKTPNEWLFVARHRNADSNRARELSRGIVKRSNLLDQYLLPIFEQRSPAFGTLRGTSAHAQRCRVVRWNAVIFLSIDSKYFECVNASTFARNLAKKAQKNK